MSDAHGPRLLVPGAVVEVARQGCFDLAVIRDVSDGTWEIVDAERRRDRVGRRAIVLALGLELSPELPPEAVERTLVALEREAEAVQPSDSDLADLWDMLLDAPEFVELDTATDLLFSGEVTPAHRLAALRAMRADRLRFKCRDGDRISARGRDAVARREAEIAAAERFEGGRSAFVRRAAAILGAAPSERESMLADALEDEVFAAYLELVEGYAAHGDGAPTARDADTLIDEIQAAIHAQVAGSHARRAFEFMVAIGRWNRDHNPLFERYDVPAGFTPAEDAAAAAARDHLPARIADLDDLGGREDFTAWRTMTIDHEETRDLDDAVSVRVLDDGNTRVAVHIAAPAAVLELDGVLERAARARGTSLYLPEGVVPMFPDAIGEDGLSLVAGQVRPALTFMADIDPGGEIVSETIVRSLICVDHRLTNREVDMELEIGGGPLADDLLDLYTVADGLYTSRQMNGAYDLGLPERKVRLKTDDYGHQRIDVEILPLHSMSRLMVGELAILANTIAARFCSARGVPVPYRTQVPPDPPIADGDFDHIPEGLARGQAMRRRMRPARTAWQPAPHFALAVPAYCQVTSPLRRYNDLLAHVQIEHVLEFGDPRLSEDAARALMEPADHAAGRGRRVQRERATWWLLRRYEQVDGPVAATVVSVDESRPTRATVVLHDAVHRCTVQTRRPHTAGDVIQVAIDSADPERGQLSLRDVSE